MPMINLFDFESAYWTERLGQESKPIEMIRGQTEFERSDIEQVMVACFCDQFEKCSVEAANRIVPAIDEADRCSVLYSMARGVICISSLREQKAAFIVRWPRTESAWGEIESAVRAALAAEMCAMSPGAKEIRRRFGSEIKNLLWRQEMFGCDLSFHIERAEAESASICHASPGRPKGMNGSAFDFSRLLHKVWTKTIKASGKYTFDPVSGEYKGPFVEFAFAVAEAAELQIRRNQIANALKSAQA